MTQRLKFNFDQYDLIEIKVKEVFSRMVQDVNPSPRNGLLMNTDWMNPNSLYLNR